MTQNGMDRRRDGSFPPHADAAGVSDAPRVPLILMRVGGIMVAAGIALAYLAWALSYSKVSLAAIAIPIGVVLLGGVLVFVIGAVSGARARQE